MDELRTYIGNKQNLAWIAYDLEPKTKQVIDFNIGNRSNRMLGKIVSTVLDANPKWIVSKIIDSSFGARMESYFVLKDSLLGEFKLGYNNYHIKIDSLWLMLNEADTLIKNHNSWFVIANTVSGKIVFNAKLNE
jgi:hypothetical protein